METLRLTFMPFQEYEKSVHTNILGQVDWYKKEQECQPILKFLFQVLQLQLTVLD